MDIYHRTRSNCLKYTKKIINFHHHILFNETCVRSGIIPNGFHIKFHHNIPEINTDDIVYKCSKKLIYRVMSRHKLMIKNLQTLLFNELKNSGLNPDQLESIKNDIELRRRRLCNILKRKRLNKYKRNNVTSIESHHDFMIFTENQSNSSQQEKSLKEKLIGDTHIPDYEPINLSNEEIDPNLASLCSKGPSFVPTPSSFNWLQILKDFDNFKHRLRSIAFYHDKNKSSSNSNFNGSSDIKPPYVCKPISKVAPQSKFPELETFLSNIEKDIFENTNRRNVKSNITKEEQIALNDWKNRLSNPDNNLILRIQDKGNRFVLVDKGTDRIKANEQINRSNFIEIDHDPTNDHIKIVNSFVTKWQKELSKEWSEFIRCTEARPGKNSTLYKTHKPDIPVRLLTTGCGRAIQHLAIFVEKYCSPLSETLPTRIKDTEHLLTIIDQLNANGLPDDAILVSFDIVNMFPSIDNQMGIDAIRDILNTRDKCSPSTQCIVEALQICLKYNNSTFDNRNLIQTNGTAMGAANSCSYADIAVGIIDKIVIEESRSNFSESLYFGRFRDDCFNIWVGSIERLNSFLELLNSICPSIQFTMEIGGNILRYLDILITKVGNMLTTTVYSKPTDSHLYLHGTSCHPQSSKNGIPIGVATRLRRICSSDEEFAKQSTTYMAYLAAREHQPKVIKESFEKIRNKSREIIRQPKSNEFSKQRKAIFSHEYNPRGPDVRKIVSKHLPLIDNSNELSKIFPKGSIVTAYRRMKNLKELMVKADPYQIHPPFQVNNPGYQKCKKGCDSCKNFVDPVSNIKCRATGKIFQIKKHITCNSNNVIYLCYCTKCSMQGTGSTTNWKRRLANYKSHIKKNVNSCAIAKHFFECCISDDPENPSKYMRFVILDVIDNADDLSNQEIENLLLCKEKFWIGSLCCIHKGMNTYHDWRRETRTQKFKSFFRLKFVDNHVPSAKNSQVEPFKIFQISP